MEVINKCISEFEYFLLEEDLHESTLPSLYEPVSYILGLGGKRVRPALVMASCLFNGGKSQDALPAAIAVELFHNFTLLHDDIMDKALTRRGKDTVHVKYDENSAILSGDVMMILAFEYLLKYESSTAKKLLSAFTKMGKELCEGQRLDMDFETIDAVSIADYIKMITYKTSVLLGACMQMGGIIGDADDETQKHLYEFGKNIGIAFQIQDDILDTFGESAEIGKKSGGDIIQNKKTYLYLKALELGTDTMKRQLNQLYSKPTLPSKELEKITEVKKIFHTLVVEEYANQLKDAYKDLAISHIEQTKIEEPFKEELKTFADYLVKRKL